MGAASWARYDSRHLAESKRNGSIKKYGCRGRRDGVLEMCLWHIYGVFMYAGCVLMVCRYSVQLLLLLLVILMIGGGGGGDSVLGGCRCVCVYTIYWRWWAKRTCALLFARGGQMSAVVVLCLCMCLYSSSSFFYDVECMVFNDESCVFTCVTFVCSVRVLIEIIVNA